MTHHGARGANICVRKQDSKAPLCMKRPKANLLFVSMVLAAGQHEEGHVQGLYVQAYMFISRYVCTVYLAPDRTLRQEAELCCRSVLGH